MYKVVLYEDQNGNSEIKEQLDDLKERSLLNKDARIQYKSIMLHVFLLQENGTWISSVYTKHIEDNIWELRPGKNRILYFYYDNDTFVLLHMFRKTTQKTPSIEIEKAKREAADYTARMGGNTK